MKDHMIVTVAISDLFVDAMDALVTEGFFPSRSEAFRHAITRFLEKQTAFITHIQHFPQAQRERMEMILHAHPHH